MAGLSLPDGVLADLPLGENTRPLIQNLGPGQLYFGPEFPLTATNGILLNPGDSYEFPTDLLNAGWPLVYVFTVGVCDVRFTSVGRDQNDR